jgi:hypothetical protein
MKNAFTIINVFIVVASAIFLMAIAYLYSSDLRYLGFTTEKLRMEQTAAQR